jgi:hypothetical protein
MARIKVRDGGDKDTVLDYLAPITGRQACTGATCAIAIASIAATDVVVVQQQTAATASYIQDVTVTAGTGIVVNLNTSPGTSTIHYAVFHPNA